jgi:hypothetical protein
VRPATLAAPAHSWETSVRFIHRLILVLAVAWPADAGAQQPAAAAPSARPFEIVDNSFLVEEAYNQESGIFQNILGAVRNEGGQWSASFTQEWPAPGVQHQLSYTLVFDNEGAGSMGDVAINYRYQLRTGEGGGTAFSPRISLLLRARRERSLEAARVGLELNLPASRQFGDIYLHGNAGVRMYPQVESSLFPSPVELQARHDVALVNPFLSGSVILRAKPMLHLMFESVVLFEERIVRRATTARDTTVILSPGTRFGWNLGEHQLVLGVAVPFEHGSGETTTGVFGYASWELPFGR